MNNYARKVTVIQSLIHSHMTTIEKDIDVSFNLNENTGYVCLHLHAGNKVGVLPLLPKSTWPEIKRHLDKKVEWLFSLDTPECSVCYNAMQSPPVTCPKCSSSFCKECYINIFRVGQGVIKCPFCRFTYGNRGTNAMVEMGVVQIRHACI